MRSLAILLVATTASGCIFHRHHAAPPPAKPAPVILITYATTEDAVRRALKAIKKQGVIAGHPQVIRIEKN